MKEKYTENADKGGPSDHPAHLAIGRKRGKMGEATNFSQHVESSE